MLRYARGKNYWSFGGKFYLTRRIPPDLAPSDYHLFRSLHNAFARRSFNDVEAVKTALQQFFDSKPVEFYRGGIYLLPDRWREVIHHDGTYVNA